MKHRRWRRCALLLGLIGVFLPAAPASAGGDNGGGGDFLLGGTAQPAQDPENSANDVIRITTSQFTVGTVSRALNVKVAALDSMLGFKSYFVAPKSCSAGIPRMTLLVDADGDGDWQQAPTSPDFAAHGHIQPFGGCLPSMWKYDDLTDLLPRWEVTPGGSVPGLIGFVNPWDTFETAVTLAFPNHSVCNGFLVDADEGSPFQTGTAYYDLISIGNATWSEHGDTAGRGFAAGCGDGGGGGDDDDDDDDNGDD